MNDMIEFFEILLHMQKTGEDVALVTVTASSGSVPRGAGARMVVGKTGRIFGTIGGGAVEHRAEKEAVAALKQKSSLLASYDLSKNAADLGMVCGGTVTVYIRYLAAPVADGEESALMALCRLALEGLNHCRPLWLLLPLGENDENPLGLYQPQSGYFPPELSCLDPEFKRFDKQTGILEKDGMRCYAEQISSGAFVHIFGGGHVSRELVPLLSRTGFFCAVYDDREDYLKAEDLPDARALVLVDFDKLSPSLINTQENYFVIMTRGHLYDMQAQAFVMRAFPSVYIGVMGSRKKTAYVFSELKKQGFSDEDLARIHTPIGLSIGAETPAEIAVSIAAELIKTRREFKMTGEKL